MEATGTSVTLVSVYQSVMLHPRKTEPSKSLL